MAAVMDYTGLAFCLECGSPFHVGPQSRLMVEWSPLGLPIYMGICPECEPFVSAIEAVHDYIVNQADREAPPIELTNAEKRYIGKQDEDALRRSALADNFADLMDEVWREEAWDRLEHRIDQAVNLTDAQERAKKRRKK